MVTIIPFGIILSITGALCGLALAVAARRLSARIWLFAGLLILAGLVAPTSMLVEFEKSFSVPLPQPLGSLLALMLFLLPSLAVVVAAMLLLSGINLYKEGRKTEKGEGLPSRRRQLDWATAAAFLLSALLILKTLYNLYWLMVWDNTSDGLTYLWLVLPVLAAIYSGVVLAFNLPGRTKLAGLLVALLIPGAMIAVSARAQRVDFRLLTEERARRVSQAVEAYHAREGHYPQDLRQLVPGSLLSIPAPVIINGQGWCYRGGEGFYQLGYVYRDHWSSPILIGRTYKTQGVPPLLPPLCEPEITAIKERFPRFYGMGGE